MDPISCSNQSTEGEQLLSQIYKNYVMRCVIWYHLYNLKQRENTHGRVLLLVNFTKSNTPPGCFSRFSKLYKWY